MFSVVFHLFYKTECHYIIEIHLEVVAYVSFLSQPLKLWLWFLDTTPFYTVVLIYVTLITIDVEPLFITQLVLLERRVYLDDFIILRIQVISSNWDGFILSIIGINIWDV